MKNRDYKEFSCGSIVHIYNRGNNKEKIFFDEQDYRAFLFRIGLALGLDASELQKEKLLSIPYSRVRINSGKNLFKLHSFCLMPNHFHLLVEQCGNVPVSKLISQVCTSFAMYINKKYKRVGHLFQDCFKTVNVESDPQLMWVSAYIHMNPVKDNLVKNPQQYVWSSYNDYVSDRNLLIVNTDFLKSLFDDTKNFKEQTLALSYVKDSP